MLVDTMLIGINWSSDFRPPWRGADLVGMNRNPAIVWMDLQSVGRGSEPITNI
jgi:hypothetical protein